MLSSNSALLKSIAQHSFGSISRYIWDESKLSLEYEDPNANLDIIFVHGFNGTARNAWTCGTGNTRKYWWSKGFLRGEIPGLRTFTYNYHVDENVLDCFPEFINEESRLLLDHLKNRRCGCASDRRTIFIARGLGGLIVKAALISAFESLTEGEKGSNIFNSTRGVVFFGTPHQRASESLSQHIASMAALSFGKQSDKSLIAEVEKLTLQLDCYKSFDRRFKNLCFHKKAQGPLPDAPLWGECWDVEALPNLPDEAVHIESNVDPTYTRVRDFILKAVSPPSSSSTSNKSSGASSRRQSESMSTCAENLRRAEHLSRSSRSQDREMAMYEYNRLMGCAEENGLCEPDTLATLAKVAKYYRQEGSYENALSCYKRIHLAIVASELDKQIMSPDAAENLHTAAHDLIQGARILGSKGQYKEGIQLLETASKICTSCDQAGLVLSDHIASFYTSLGNYGTALMLFRKLKQDYADTMTEREINKVDQTIKFIEDKQSREEAKWSPVAVTWSNIKRILADDLDGHLDGHFCKEAETSLDAPPRRNSDSEFYYPKTRPHVLLPQRSLSC